MGVAELTELTRNAANVLPDEGLQAKLELARPLRVKLGIDPSRPDLTLVDDTSVNTDANVFFELLSGKVKMWHAEFLPQMLARFVPVVVLQAR